MIVRGIRFFGALAILAVGAIHLQQYIGADSNGLIVQWIRAPDDPGDNGSTASPPTGTTGPAA